jgi:hypothetical protein
MGEAEVRGTPGERESASVCTRDFVVTNATNALGVLGNELLIFLYSCSRARSPLLYRRVSTRKRLRTAMSYLLEFPPSTLPDDIRRPPYIIFGINGESVVDMLPKLIPLNAVLHFIPDLAQYVLPAPEDLPEDVAKGVLRTPFVGIDIRLDIGIAAVQLIIMKVLQSAGMAVPKHQLQHLPTTITSLSIRKTWLLLDLHPAGLDGLLIHLLTRLVTGPPVTLVDIRHLWAHFPSNSDVVRVMAVNFVQSHLGLFYNMEEFSAIRRWYTVDKERHRVFKVAEDQFPDFGKMLSIKLLELAIVNNPPLEESRRKTKEKNKIAAEETAAAMAGLNTRMEGLNKKTTANEARKVGSFAESRQKTIRKSANYKSAPGLKDVAKSAEDLSAKLTRALHKVQLERDAQDAAEGRSEEVLQPTLHDPFKNTF